MKMYFECGKNVKINTNYLPNIHIKIDGKNRVIDEYV